MLVNPETVYLIVYKHYRQTLITRLNEYRKIPVINPPLLSRPVIGPSTWKQKNTSGYKPPPDISPPVVFSQNPVHRRDSRLQDAIS